MLTLLHALLMSAPPADVELHYHERPPYYLSTAQGPQGLVIAPLRQALRVSGLPHRFVSTPALRQLQLIKQGQAMVCGVGWFFNADRAGKGQFSKPIYRDRPLVMLVRTQLGWTQPRSMAEAIGDADARLLLKAGYSYGSQFDALLKSRSAPPASITGEMQTLVRMLVHDRADWTPMAAEEAEYEFADIAGLRLLPFSDAVAGNVRYLYCNKAVPAAWLQRLDAAIPTMSEPLRR